MKELTAIPDELCQALNKGQLTLFIGAGLSIASGLSNWNDLVRPLANSINYPWPSNEKDITSEHLLKITEGYKLARGNRALVDYLRDTLNKRVNLSEIHRILPKFEVKYILTTNYDSLIERSFDESLIPRQYHIIAPASEAEIALQNRDEVQIVKICGRLDHASSIKITRSQFGLYAREHPLMTSFIQRIFSETTVLFLGSSFRDPLINTFWDMIGFDFGEMRRMGYITLFDASPHELHDLQNRGLHPILLLDNNVNKTHALDLWLSNLLDCSRGLDNQNDDSPHPKLLDHEGVIDRLQRIEIKTDELYFLSASTKDLTQVLLDLIYSSKLEQNKILSLAEQINEWARSAQSSGQHFDKDIEGKINLISSSYADAREYLQLSLPLIPGILSYHVDLGAKLETDLRNLLAKIRNYVD